MVFYRLPHRYGDDFLAKPETFCLYVSPFEGGGTLICLNVSPFPRGGDSRDVEKNGEPRRGKGSRAILKL